MTLTKTLSPTGVLISVNGNDLKQPQVLEDIVDEVSTVQAEVDALEPPLASAIVANVSATNVETLVASLSIPANTMAVGSTYKLTAYAIKTGANATVPDFLVRLGPTTLTGSFAALLTGIDVGNGGTFKIEALMTVRSIGVSGSIMGGMTQVSSAAGSSPSNIGSAITVDTTVANLMELTCNSNNVANSYSFRVATFAKVA